MALIFWYGGQLLSRYELSAENYFIVYTAIMFGGQAAGFSFGFSAS
jgi:ATP-binding cassette subfamily B (MDR/TAP) protein 1